MGLRVLICILCVSTQAYAKEPKRIVITTFQPFVGTVNRTERVGPRIQEYLQEDYGPDVEVTVCNLPVEFEGSFKKMQECIDGVKPKPDVVISLGEGECVTEIETTAANCEDTGTPDPVYRPDHPALLELQKKNPKKAARAERRMKKQDEWNLRHRRTDNAGQIREEALINPQGPLQYISNLPIYEMYCSLDDNEKNEVFLSSDMGNFICNSLSYKMNQLAREKGIQFGFIHIPGFFGCPTPTYLSEGQVDQLIAHRIAKMFTPILGKPPQPIRRQYKMQHLLQKQEPGKCALNEKKSKETLQLLRMLNNYPKEGCTQ